MMKKFFVLVCVIVFGTGFNLRADEGMWLPLLIDRLNYVDMQRLGLQLTPEEIYSVNHGSIKDAIVTFGGGCTGSIISDQGLLITNHHCGYGAIQSQSSVEHDYLKDGFWATSQREELPIAGLTVKFLISIEDVTSKVLAELDQTLSEADRNTKLKDVFDQMQSNAVKGTHYEAVVKSFFEGNEFYLFVYEVFKDVRLVGAPPEAIGQFGGDTDNWMWPRHTCDFSIFRVYSGPDGKPAEYSEQNIPMKPKYFLPISNKGLEKNDFVMLMGYPGNTDRYLTSYGIEYYIQHIYPFRIAIRKIKMDILKNDMNFSDAIRIKYASKYAGISNYWKNFIGTMKSLHRLRIADRMREEESQFADWVSLNGTRGEQYGKALSNISVAYEELKKYILARIFFAEAIMGCDGMMFSKRFESLVELLKSDTRDQVKIDAKISELKEAIKTFYKSYNAPTDQKMTSSMLQLYAGNVPKSQQPQYFLDICLKYKNDFDKLASELFVKSAFVDQSRNEALLVNPSASKIEKDGMYLLMKCFYDASAKNTESMTSANNQLAGGKRVLLAGLREMFGDRKFYPDANQTMRLSYGKVLDYYPADAMHYDYYTTLAGVMEKEDPGNSDYTVPSKLKELYKNRDFGRWAEDGMVRACFLSNMDITGGNSGSPVLNSRGQLVGLVFDGNWEAMSGNVMFEPQLQRCISVDIRYALFIVDKYAGSQRIIDEIVFQD